MNFKFLFSQKKTKMTQTEKDRIIEKYGGYRALKSIPQSWTIVKRLGRGAYGEVFLIRKDDRIRVVKFQKASNKYNILYEVWMQMNFFKFGLAPKVHNFDIWDDQYSSITMDYIDILENHLSIKRSESELHDIVNKLNDLLSTMCKHKFRHNDLHWGNIGIDKHLNLVLIDFGKASIGHKKCYKSGEWFQLARTLRNAFKENMNNQNKNYLSIHILDKFLDAIRSENVVLPKKIQTVEDLYGVMDEAVGYLRPTIRYKTNAIRSLTHAQKLELFSRKI
jgi:tRNA A-37 threonylcarbamoyl transferase component Bud32